MAAQVDGAEQGPRVRAVAWRASEGAANPARVSKSDDLLPLVRAAVTGDAVEAEALLAKHPPTRIKPEETTGAAVATNAVPALAGVSSLPSRPFSKLGVFWAAQSVAQDLPFAQGSGRHLGYR